MRLPLNSLLGRIVWLHLVAVAAMAVVLPLAVRLLLNSTASSFEHQTVRRREAAIAEVLDHQEPHAPNAPLRPAAGSGPDSLM